MREQDTPTSEDDERERGIRVEVRPEQPPLFTIRATLLVGRVVLAESRRDYPTMLGALTGLREIGSDMASRTVSDYLQSMTPDAFELPE